jgi:putative PIN family toxin of toxin-antitoxin system
VRVVVDTNVFISGFFFRGPPYQILQAWSENKIEVVLSPEILIEYKRAGEEFSGSAPDPDLNAFLRLLTTKAIVVSTRQLPNKICKDPDDDKFLAAALSGGAKVITSGDKALLAVSGYRAIEVLRPRDFVDRYLL